MVHREWQMKNGEWEMAHIVNGNWRMVNEEWHRE